LSIEEGKPIVEELIMRGDVVEKLKEVRLALSALFPFFRSHCVGCVHTATKSIRRS
jgi:hypothetical protein